MRKLDRKLTHWNEIMKQAIDNSYRYILRYLICPTHNPNDRIEELAQFCREAKVQEVMLL